jgi:hypothetical protein
MKKLSASALILALIFMAGCKSKPSYTKKHLDPKASTFYVVCAQETGGYCSPTPYSTYASADSALQAHRTQTGHTDNSVENDCPFGTDK